MGIVFVATAATFALSALVLGRLALPGTGGTAKRGHRAHFLGGVRRLPAQSRGMAGCASSSVSSPRRRSSSAQTRSSLVVMAMSCSISETPARVPEVRLRDRSPHRVDRGALARRTAATEPAFIVGVLLWDSRSSSSASGRTRRRADPARGRRHRELADRRDVLHPHPADLSGQGPRARVRGDPDALDPDLRPGRPRRGAAHHRARRRQRADRRGRVLAGPGRDPRTTAPPTRGVGRGARGRARPPALDPDLHTAFRALGRAARRAALPLRVDAGTLIVRQGDEGERSTSSRRARSG